MSRHLDCHMKKHCDKVSMPQRHRPTFCLSCSYFLHTPHLGHRTSHQRYQHIIHPLWIQWGGVCSGMGEYKANFYEYCMSAWTWVKPLESAEMYLSPSTVYTVGLAHTVVPNVHIHFAAGTNTPVIYCYSQKHAGLQCMYRTNTCLAGSTYLKSTHQQNKVLVSNST